MRSRPAPANSAGSTRYLRGLTISSGFCGPTVPRHSSLAVSRSTRARFAPIARPDCWRENAAADQSAIQPEIPTAFAHGSISNRILSAISSGLLPTRADHSAISGCLSTSTSSRSVHAGATMPICPSSVPVPPRTTMIIPSSRDGSTCLPARSRATSLVCPLASIARHFSARRSACSRIFHPASFEPCGCTRYGSPADARRNEPRRWDR